MIFVISLRSCTERHGDFSESVVFHSSYKVSWWFLGSLFVFGCCFVCVGLFLVVLDG